MEIVKIEGEGKKPRIRFLLACRQGHQFVSDKNIERQNKPPCTVCGAEVVWSFQQTETE